MAISSLLNRNSKYLVSGAVGVALFWMQSEQMAWGVVGAVGVGLCAKLLKRALKVPRPSAALEGDHGMPSSHASCISYLAAYTSLFLLEHSFSPAAVVPVPAGAAGLIVLRVTQGNHTVPQVLAGVALGVPAAWVWRFCLVDAAFFERLHAEPQARAAFWGVVLAACGVFALMMVRPKPRKHSGRVGGVKGCADAGETKK